ncbi:hypothetical protein SLA2020_189030 [Shorea laevis]
MEINSDPPPPWPQLTMNHRRRSPSPLLTPQVLIILLPILALLLFFIIVPPFLSVTTQILRPNPVKKSWDSLNIFLVLFAILCGVFARRNDDGSAVDDDNNVGKFSLDGAKPKYHSVSNSQQWFEEYSERKVYDDRPMSSAASGVGRLRRSSSSYPDLRQDSLWGNGGDDRFRFFDDFEISKYRAPTAADDYVQLRQWRSEFEVESEAKDIAVDTFVLRTSPPSPSPSHPPPPPPPPPPAVRHKPRRTYQTVGRKEREEKATQQDAEFNRVKTPPPTPPPPPPPRPPPSPVLVRTAYRSEQRNGKSERRKSNATKEIKMVLASLYNQRKRKKKQKTRNHDQWDVSPSHSPPETSPYDSPATPPPPPPPLPPPPSVFYSFFKKGSKSKKIHSVPAPPPPPPQPAFSSSKRSKHKTHIPPPPQPPPTPPPPQPAFSSSKRSKQKTHIPSPPPAPPTPPPEPSRRRTPSSSGKPPLPTKANTFYEENLNSGGQSPLIPMPPPPPPPPFKIPDIKFVSRGGFVRLGSANSSRCSSPELEDDVDISPNKEDPENVSSVGGGDSDAATTGGSVFCPSPDVNVKADTFIARFRDGLKLEKMNSLREKRKAGHGLGPTI